MPDPAADDGLGAMPDDPVDVIWEVAADDRFRSVVARGVTTASPDRAHAVHVDVTGLEPATDYHYRFKVGEWTSPPGRTRTLPVGSAGPVPDRRGQLPVARDGRVRRVPPHRRGRHRPRAAPRRLRVRVRRARHRRGRASRWPTGACSTPATGPSPGSPPRTPATRSSARGTTTRSPTTIMGDVLEGSDDPAVAPVPQGRRLPGLVGAPAGADRTARRPDLRRVPGGHDRRPGPHPRARRAAGRGRAARAATRRPPRATPATAPTGSTRTAPGSATDQEQLARREPGRGRRDVVRCSATRSCWPASTPGPVTRRRSTSTPGTGSPTPASG